MRTTTILSPDLWSPLGVRDIVDNRQLAHAFREWAHVLFESRSTTVPKCRGDNWMRLGREVAARAELCSPMGTRLMAYSDDITSRKIYWATVEVRDGRIASFDGVYDYNDVDPYWKDTPLAQYGLSQDIAQDAPAEQFLVGKSAEHATAGHVT